MGRWRLEWARIWRTRRVVALGATFLVLGFGLPLMTYYLPDLIKNSNSGLRITVSRQTAADAMRGFAGNVGQLGTLLVAVVAAANVSVDGNPALARFYRSRVDQPIRLVVPRYLMVTAASIGALALGTLAAAYETRLLFGPFSLGAVAVGFALQSAWLCFVTSAVTFFASVVRGVVGVVGASVAFFLGLALVGSMASNVSWLPTRLAASGAALLDHPAGNLWQAVVVCSVASAAALGCAVVRFGRREL